MGQDKRKSDQSKLDLKHLDAVVEETIIAVEQGREQIVAIIELGSSEVERIRAEYERLKEEMVAIITEVDKMEATVKRSRVKLMELHRDFDHYSESQVREAYSNAQEVQIRLALLREQERFQRAKRDEIERRLIELSETTEKAKMLENKITAAIDFLKGNFTTINTEIDKFQRRQEMVLRVIQAQEDERRRLAREVHDGPAQSLAGAILRIEVCERLCRIDSERARAELNELKEIIRDNLREVRNVIYDLRPMGLDDVGLVLTLKRYFASLEEKGWPHIEYTAGGDEDLVPIEYKASFFRILQEAMSNIHKHSQATRVTVDITISQEDGMDMFIRDNGVGFDIDTKLEEVAKNGDHYGIMGMRERTELLQGSFEMKSQPGQGTLIRINIPVPSAEESDSIEQSGNAGNVQA